MESEYEPPKVNDDVDEGVFLFQKYRRAVFRTRVWDPGVRNDVISFKENKDQPLLDKLKIRANLPPPK